MRAAPFVLAAALASCGEPAVIAPPGLAPLEINTAVFPPQDAGTYPETLATTKGHNAMFAWVHARGYVLAPLADTWAAARDPVVCVDRRQVHDYVITRDTNPDYQYSYSIRNTVQHIITLTFDLDWIHGVTAGTLTDPTAVGARFDKSHAPSLIAVFRGSVVLARVTDSVTAIELIEQVSVITQTEDVPELAMRDYYASIVARAHGRDLPAYP